MSQITFGLIDSSLIDEIDFTKLESEPTDRSGDLISRYILTRSDNDDPMSIVVRQHNRLLTRSELERLIDQTGKDIKSYRLETEKLPSAGNTREFKNQ